MLVKRLLILFLCISLFLSVSCNDGTTSPQEEYGFFGKTIDTNGNPISGVKIYCLFYLSSVPQEITTIEKNNTSSIDSSKIDLFYNFPNPFSGSTFLRFAIPEKCDCSLRIISLKNSSSYIYQETLQEGIYQRFFPNLVNKFGLKNGVHKLLFEAVSDSNIYKSETNLLIISDQGIPNAITDTKGIFFFDYKEAFIGDSIPTNYNGQVNNTIILSNNINLLIVKEGYKNKIEPISLYPKILLRRDIVLEKENQYEN